MYASDQVRPGSKQFLTFHVSTEEYGLDILRVQEIRSYEPPTRVANAPHFVKGVVNLRGVIVPIVDLRLRLGQSGEYNAFTVVIVLNVCQRVVGIVVDAVSDVLELNADQIKARPEVAAARADSYSAQTTLYATHKRILALEARIVDLEAALAAHAALPAEDAHDARTH